MPDAWVVKCTGCGCTVNAKAVDSQAEATEPGKAEPAPQTAMMVTCACCWECYRYSTQHVFKGMPQPNENCRHWKARLAAEKNGNSTQQGKEPSGAVVVAATLTAAMLLRQELNDNEIKPVPRVVSKIDTSVRLAEMVLRHIKRR